MSDDLKTLVAQEVAKQLAAIAADQTTKKVLEYLKNRNSADAYVIETWSSGSDWYRVWSDGFIEQGGFLSESGQTQITLNKPFQNTNYCVLFSFYKSSWVQGIWTETRYTNRIEIRGGSSASQSGSTTKPAFWHASGY